MDNSININKKYKYLFVIMIVFVVLLAGGTLAYLIMNVIATNDKYNTVTTCLEVDYDLSNDDGTIPISGNMLPSNSAISGLNGKVGLKINDSCSLEGIGTLSLNVVSSPATLIQEVDGHCENSETLETLTNIRNSSDCTSNSDNVWVTEGSALKYAVYDTNEISNDVLPVSVGYVNKIGKIDIYNDFFVTKTNVTYYIYIWLDGNLSDNSYAGLSFVGNISSSVVQKKEEIGPSFDDPTLMITSYTCDDENGNPVTVGDNPYFTYTGQCEVVDDGDGDWRVKFLTSGEFESTLSIPIDVFLVGGGGGGGNGSNSAGSGGGGGYTTTATRFKILSENQYSIIVGEGGQAGDQTSGARGETGETSSGFGYSAAGGQGGAGIDSSGNIAAGGKGGSGGGAYSQYSGTATLGGTDGSTASGLGQGTTTREFGEANGILYSGGGTGGGYYSTDTLAPIDETAGYAGNSPLANRGGGGGGSMHVGYNNATAGGSGIVIIRNKR